MIIVWSLKNSNYTGFSKITFLKTNFRNWMINIIDKSLSDEYSSLWWKSGVSSKINFSEVFWTLFLDSFLNVKSCQITQIIIG